jgi:hypothetical protein
MAIAKETFSNMLDIFNFLAGKFETFGVGVGVGPEHSPNTNPKPNPKPNPFIFLLFF